MYVILLLNFVFPVKLLIVIVWFPLFSFLPDELKRVCFQKDLTVVFPSLSSFVSSAPLCRPLSALSGCTPGCSCSARLAIKKT